MKNIKRVLTGAAVINTVLVTCLYIIAGIMSDFSSKLTPNIIYSVLFMSLFLSLADLIISKKVSLGRAVLLFFVDYAVINGILALKFVRGFDSFEQFIVIGTVISLILIAVISVRCAVIRRAEKRRKDAQGYKELYK